MDENDAFEPYWSGDHPCVRLRYARGAFPSEDVEKVLEVLEDFRPECQKAYLAFNGMTNGRLTISANLECILENAARHVEAFDGSSGSSPAAAASGIGDGPPLSREGRRGTLSSVPTHYLKGQGQVSAGKRVLGTAGMNMVEFVDSLAKGGEFEDWHNKAFVVMLYQRWEESYRCRIAQALGLEKNKVRCSLMGEVRLLRNVIIHDNGEVAERFSAPLLSRIWGAIPLGFLFITDGMATAMVKQLNAVLVEVG